VIPRPGGPTDCGGSLWLIKKPKKKGGKGPRGAFAKKKKKKKHTNVW